MEDKFVNMCKNQEEMKKNQEEMKNYIAAVKNSIENIKSRLEKAEDCISELEDSTWEPGGSPSPATVTTGRHLQDHRALLIFTLTWHCLLTCSTIPLWSCCHRGLAGPAVPPLLPTASTALLMPTMFRATFWWSAHIIPSGRTPDRGLETRVVSTTMSTRTETNCPSNTQQRKVAGLLAMAESGTGSMELEPRVTLQVGGKPVSFLVDTGAAYSVLTEPMGPVTSKKTSVQGATGQIACFPWTSKRTNVRTPCVDVTSYRNYLDVPPYPLRGTEREFLRAVGYCHLWIPGARGDC
ncbi:hypothetical protein QTO34_000534 [Cnephaeus nilssonii]|uniref:Peptidase A2 domain-containing protein n=1 Tax=Cnephaeus nilssonii TaxID=3371016 RepID=A0AA40IBL5_CNENI|nr:hypothetical protein QTO34_000534 [Eptesicus nilssonii]